MENVMDEIKKSVNVFVSLTNICKIHEKVSCNEVTRVEILI